MTSEQGQCRAAPRKYSDFNALNISFMREHGLTPCFAWAATTSVFHAPRLELYRTAESIEELEFWSREARVLRNGKKAVVWRHGDLKFDFMHGIMDLKDAQGTRWTSDKWDLLRSGLKAAKVKEPSEMPASPGGEPREQQGLQQHGLQQLNGNKENGHGKAEEMVLSLIKKLPADQRRMLSGKLRATEADTTIDQGRKAEIASGIIAKAAESLEQQISQEEDMPKRVEVPCGVEESQGPGRAWEGYALSLSEHRKDMLRVILNDEAIDREWKDKMVSDLLTNWFNEDAQGRAILESAEEQPDRVNLSVGEVVSSGVDIDNGKQDMGELAPLEEQHGLELAEDRNRGLPGEGDEQPGPLEEQQTENGLSGVMGVRGRGLPTVEDSNGVSVRAGLSISEEGTPDGEIQRVGIEKQGFPVIEDDDMGDELLKEIAKECEKRQFCAGENHGPLLPEVMAVSSGSSTRGVEDVWDGYTDNCYRVFEEKIGDFGAIDTQNITKGDLVEHSGQRLGDLIDFGGLKEASVSHGTVDVLGDEAGVSVLLDEQPVTMDKVESEEMFYLGKIEIGVCAGEPYIAKEREVSVITSMEIIAGDDVKEKDIGKSGDFQVGGAIRDDSIVSIMSMDYEGCCFQEESMETQRQERDVVDYNSDDGDTTSAKFKYGRPAFAPGGIGMFVVTGRPPGRLIGG